MKENKEEKIIIRGAKKKVSEHFGNIILQPEENDMDINNKLVIDSIDNLLTTTKQKNRMKKLQKEDNFNMNQNILENIQSYSNNKKEKLEKELKFKTLSEYDFKQAKSEKDKDFFPPKKKVVGPKQKKKIVTFENKNIPIPTEGNKLISDKRKEMKLAKKKDTMSAKSSRKRSKTRSKTRSKRRKKRKKRRSKRRS